MEKITPFFLRSYRFIVTYLLYMSNSILPFQTFDYVFVFTLPGLCEMMISENPIICFNGGCLWRILN